MLKTSSLICLLFLAFILLFSAAFMLDRLSYAVARDVSNMNSVTLVHTTTADSLASNEEHSTINTMRQMPQNSSAVSQEQKQSAAAVKNFQNAFCGVDGAVGKNYYSNGYITEYLLPQSCEMPLGIAFDTDDLRIWYVSTKKGILGSYDLRQDRFDREHTIPLWNSREDQTGFSQVWSVKINKHNANNNNKQGGDIWFTDAKQNAIWKYMKNSELFEMYKIPGRSSSFGTIYPISLGFNSKSNKILFAGTYSPSIWIGDIAQMKNGTSDGITQVPIPIDNSTTFNGIDPLYITVGSLTVDNKRNSVWVSVFSYGNKGEILSYNLETQTFDRRFDLPPELSSPVGLEVDDNNAGHLWITNGGSSMFYELNPNNGKIVKYVTSKVSPRIFGQALFDEIDDQKKIQDDENINENISKNAYTLPYWIQKSGDGSLWFNEQEGNKIARFDPHGMRLIEYWVPSQNRLWGSCGDNSNNNGNSENIENNSNTNNQTCGIANVLQFSLSPQQKDNNVDNKHSSGNSKGDNHEQRQQQDLQQHVWFTEWSENKIAKLNANDQLLPFSVALPSIPHNKEITIKRGESKEIKIRVMPRESTFSTISNTMDIHMVASSTFTPTGGFGNSTASFSEQWFSINNQDDNSNHDILFTFTPSMDLKPGQYTLIVGAENYAVSYQRAIKLKVI
jgi:virginiamycin B lyase